MTRTSALLLTLEIGTFALRHAPEPKPLPSPAPVRGMTAEEIRRGARLMQERRKAEREWDRVTFEEVGP